MEKIIETLKNSDCEGTRSPYWLILDPKQNMDCDIHRAATQITGPFFSRVDAECVLKGFRHHYSKRAYVYCLSGCYSKKYDDLCKELDKI